jgi:hypothetical protein
MRRDRIAYQLPPAYPARRFLLSLVRISGTGSTISRQWPAVIVASGYQAPRPAEPIKFLPAAIVVLAKLHISPGRPIS